MKSLLTPGIFLAAVAALLHTGLLAPNVALVTYAFGAAIIAGLLLAWRFHSSRIFFAVLSLFLAQQAISYFSQGRVAATGPGSTAHRRSRLALASQLRSALVSARKGIYFPQPRASSAVALRRVGNRRSALPPRTVSHRATRSASRCHAGAASFRHAAGIRCCGNRVAHPLPAVPQARLKADFSGHSQRRSSR